jgi:hypothetical protein
MRTLTISKSERIFLTIQRTVIPKRLLKTVHLKLVMEYALMAVCKPGSNVRCYHTDWHQCNVYACLLGPTSAQVVQFHVCVVYWVFKDVVGTFRQFKSGYPQVSTCVGYSGTRLMRGGGIQTD